MDLFRRPAVILCLALVAVAALAGCVDGNDGASGDPPTDSPEESPGTLTGAAEDTEDLAGLPPGVASEPVATAEGSAEGSEDGDPSGLLPTGGAEGVVYDHLTGTPLEGADVVAQCGDETLLGARATATSDGDGRFTIPAVVALTECDEVHYEVFLAGYHMRLPLDSGPFQADLVYRVHAAMEADA